MISRLCEEGSNWAYTSHQWSQEKVKSLDLKLWNLSGTMTEKKFPQRRNIKVSPLLSLTSFRMKKLEEAQENFSFSHVWTTDGNIMFKNENGKPSIYYG